MMLHGASSSSSSCALPGIYSIYRIDLASKAVTYITGGAGGAARPTPSHTGDYVAFVRRTRFTSSLVLYDVATTNEVILYGDLSEDQQESSAPSGVYPQFAWTPDDSAIIIWSRGGLLRISVSDGSAQTIPFTVRPRYTLAPDLSCRLSLTGQVELAPKDLLAPVSLGRPPSTTGLRRRCARR